MSSPTNGRSVSTRWVPSTIRRRSSSARTGMFERRAANDDRSLRRVARLRPASLWAAMAACRVERNAGSSPSAGPVGCCARSTARSCAVAGALTPSRSHHAAALSACSTVRVRSAASAAHRTSSRSAASPPCSWRRASSSLICAASFPYCAVAAPCRVRCWVRSACSCSARVARRSLCRRRTKTSSGVTGASGSINPRSSTPDPPAARNPSHSAGRSPRAPIWSRARVMSSYPLRRDWNCSTAVSLRSATCESSSTKRLNVSSMLCTPLLD